MRFAGVYEDDLGQPRPGLGVASGFRHVTNGEAGPSISMIDRIVHTTEHLRAVENELNNRPRRVLDDQPPATLFAALLRSKSPSVSQR